MKTLTACALVLAVFAGSASGADAATAKKKKGYSRDHYVSKNHKVRPQVRGYITRGGGYAYGYENEPFLYRNGPYGNYPSFDDRNFWERVNSDPFNTRPGASGL